EELAHGVDKAVANGLGDGVAPGEDEPPVGDERHHEEFDEGEPGDHAGTPAALRSSVAATFASEYEQGHPRFVRRTVRPSSRVICQRPAMICVGGPPAG